MKQGFHSSVLIDVGDLIWFIQLHYSLQLRQTYVYV